VAIAVAAASAVSMLRLIGSIIWATFPIAAQFCSTGSLVAEAANARLANGFIDSIRSAAAVGEVAGNSSYAGRPPVLNLAAAHELSAMKAVGEEPECATATDRRDLARSL
jgi:hypothetical protein